jgi:hypothetical protein
VGLDDSIPDFTTVPSRTTLRIHTVRLAPQGSRTGPQHYRFSLGTRSLAFLHTARPLGTTSGHPDTYNEKPEFSLTSVTPLMVLRQNEALLGGLVTTNGPGSRMGRNGGTGDVPELGELCHEFSVWGELSEDP